VRRSGRGVAGLMLGVVLLSCRYDDVLQPYRPATVNLSEVTPEVARALDGAGRFTLDLLGGAEPNELPRARAESLAVAFAGEWARPWRDVLESERRGSIDLDRLHLCRGTLFAASPYEQVGGDVPLRIRTDVGGQWLVTFCGRREDAEVSVAVAAAATGAQLVNGKVVFPGPNLEGFSEAGVPSTDADMPVSAEAAVALIARLSRARVAAVPALLQRGISRLAQTAIWRIVLTPPERSRGAIDSASRVDSVFFVEGDYEGSHVLRAMADAKTVDSVAYRVGQNPDSLVLDTIALRRQPGAPGRLERVTFVPGN
jgi:hypothetical protein